MCSELTSRIYVIFNRRNKTIAHKNQKQKKPKQYVATKTNKKITNAHVSRVYDKNKATAVQYKYN